MKRAIAPTPSRLQALRTSFAQLGIGDGLRLYALKLARRLLLPSARLHFGNSAEDILVLYLAENYLGKRSLTYVDVGCHEPQRISNSYLAYVAGGSGLVIDLNPSFQQPFARHRPRDVFVCAAVSDDDADALVHEYRAAEVATINPRQAAAWDPIFGATGTRTVHTARLEDLVARHLPGRPVDVLMMDVEGHELPVLRGANLASLAPGMIVCEVHSRTISETQGSAAAEYLNELGYVMVAHAAASTYFIRGDLVGPAKS